MSTELNTLKSEVQNDVHVTSFWGGEDRGCSVQLTQQAVSHGRDQFQIVRLTKAQAVELIHTLTDWVAE